MTLLHPPNCLYLFPLAKFPDLSGIISYPGYQKLRSFLALACQFWKPVYQSKCDTQLDRQEQSKNNKPGTEGYQGRKPWGPSNGQNWENKDLALRETFPLLACSSGLILHVAGHVAQTLPWLFLPGRLLVMWIRPLKGGTNKVPENSPLAISYRTMRFWPTSNASGALLCFSSRPRKASNQTSNRTALRTSCIELWYLDLLSNSETTILKGHTSEVDEYSVEILALKSSLKSPPLKAFNTEDASSSLLEPGLCLSLSSQGTLPLEPISSTAQFFYLCNLLNIPSLILGLPNNQLIMQIS